MLGTISVFIHKKLKLKTLNFKLTYTEQLINTVTTTINIHTGKIGGQNIR